MAHAPKTPIHRRSRSEAKAPLTPSLIAGLNSVSLASGTKYKQADTTNPFISSSRPASSSRRSRAISTGRPTTSSRPSSPIKWATSSAIDVSESLQRQASSGVIRRGGIESRLDVVTRDYVPPPQSEKRRSKSQPAVSTFEILVYIIHLSPVLPARYTGSFHYYSQYHRRCYSLIGGTFIESSVGLSRAYCTSSGGDGHIVEPANPRLPRASTNFLI